MSCIRSSNVYHTINIKVFYRFPTSSLKMCYYIKIRVFKSFESLSQQFFFGLVTKPYLVGGQGTRLSVALVAIETQVILKYLFFL